MAAHENRRFEKAQVFATPRGLGPRWRWVLKVHDGLLKQVLWGCALLALCALLFSAPAQARTVQEDFRDALKSFMTTAGAPWSLKARTSLPLLMKNLNDALLHPDLSAERPHVFVAQGAAFVRWLGQADGVQDRSELTGFLVTKLGQLLDYAEAAPGQETPDWAAVALILAETANRRHPGGMFDDLISRAKRLSALPCGVLRNNPTVSALLRDGARLALMDDTLWLDLADTFAANALTGREIIVQKNPPTAAPPVASAGGLTPLDADPFDEAKVLRDFGVLPGTAPPPVNPQLPATTPETASASQPGVVVMAPPGETLPVPLSASAPPTGNPLPSPLTNQPPAETTPPETVETLAPPVATGTAPPPMAVAAGQPFVVPELGLKVTPPSAGWSRDAQSLGGSVTFLNGPSRFTIQPETVADASAHMDQTVQGLRRVGFEVSFSNLSSTGAGYQLVVAKAPLSQWVELKKVGDRWFLITATTNARDFELSRPNLEKMSQSVEAM